MSFLPVLGAEGFSGPNSLAGSSAVGMRINFTLNPGDEFFVWAGIEAGGVRDGFGDGFNTLSMSYSDDTGITPSAVPVPAAVWLFASGMLGLVGIARRARAA